MANPNKQTSFLCGQIVQLNLTSWETLVVEKVTDSEFLQMLLTQQTIKQHTLVEMWKPGFLEEITLTNNDNGLLLSSFDIILDNKEKAKFFVVLFGEHKCLIRESEIKAASK